MDLSLEPLRRPVAFSSRRLPSLLSPLQQRKWIFKENRLAQKGKSLTYVPPTTMNERVFVSIVEDDLKFQEEYMKTTLIGYVIGDTLYLK